MRPRLITLEPADANLIEFASNVTGDTWTLTKTETSDGIAHKVSIKNDSVTNHSLKTAVLTGTDENGNPQEETVNLPGSSLTIESTKYFKTLTSVVPSASIGADTMDIGMAASVTSQWLMLDYRMANSVICDFSIIGAVAINYTLQFTNYNIQDETLTPVWKDSTDSVVVNATTDQVTNLVTIPIAIRTILNSYSSGAKLEWTTTHNNDR